MRYFVEFSYDGAAYHGWQRQPNAFTVQECLEQAFATLLRNPVELVGAGRTDAGVHARQMFAHFDWEDKLDEAELQYRLNALLPADIAVHTLSPMQPDAHARFDALSRTYEYWITPQKNPFYRESAYWVKYPLDVEAMNRAASLLVRQGDFECFSRTHTDVKTFICDVQSAYWEMEGDRLVFTITADRFLRNMVRAVVGTLLEVGLGKKPVSYLEAVLASKDRGQAGASVPAKGLYLTRIQYPQNIYG